MVGGCRECRSGRQIVTDDTRSSCRGLPVRTVPGVQLSRPFQADSYESGLIRAASCACRRTSPTANFSRFDAVAALRRSLPGPASVETSVNFVAPAPCTPERPTSGTPSRHSAKHRCIPVPGYAAISPRSRPGQQESNGSNRWGRFTKPPIRRWASTNSDTPVPRTAAPFRSRASSWCGYAMDSSSNPATTPTMSPLPAPSADSATWPLRW